MNLEKQIKRHIIGPRHTFFASVLPGFEAICRRELDQLSDTIEIASCVTGGVIFTARLVDLYRANLSLHSAGRILMRVAEFKATNFRQLAKRIGAIRWSLYLPHGVVPRLKFTSHRSRLHHSQAVADTISPVIENHWKAHGIAPIHDQDQTLFMRMDKDVATLSLDSSGENLYRRGLKSHHAEAPLRETTAAIILAQAGFGPNPKTILLDPMCGSGTFSLEAALMCKNIAPGSRRNFAFMQWPAFRPRQWGYLKNQADNQVSVLSSPMILASDMEPKTCERFRSCVEDNGLADAVQVRNDDFFHLLPHQITSSPGLVVLNPPYGQRLNKSQSNAQFYRRIETKLCKDFKSWQIAMITPQPKWLTKLCRTLEPAALSHGGLKLTLLSGKI